MDDLSKMRDRILGPAGAAGKALSPFPQLRESFPSPKRFDLPIQVVPKDPNLAAEFHRRLVAWVDEFDKSLDQEHEVGVRLVSFGQSLTLHLEGMGYWNPSLIAFYGTTVEGEPVELIQHVSQISVLLIKVRRLDPSKPKRPIGFRSNHDKQEATAASPTS